MARTTQPRTHAAMTGRRYGSFSGKTLFTGGDDTISSVSVQAAQVSSHYPALNTGIRRSTFGFRFALPAWLVWPRLGYGV